MFDGAHREVLEVIELSALEYVNTEIKASCECRVCTSRARGIDSSLITLIGVIVSTASSSSAARLVLSLEALEMSSYSASSQSTPRRDLFQALGAL